MFDNDDDFWEEPSHSIEELLKRFEQLKKGQSNSLLEEEEFEKIIDFYFQNNQEENALNACDIARVYYPFSSSILLLKAELLTQAQKYGQALKILDELDQYDKHNLDAVLLHSDIFLSQKKPFVAAEFLEENINLFDKEDQIEIWLELTEVYDECENYEAIYTALVNVLKIDNRNEEALQKICFWADFCNKLEESVTLHIDITNEEPYNTLAWFNLGAAYQGLKLYEKSIDAYEFCVAIDEKFEFAYRNMADAYMRLKWFDQALDVLQKHLEISKPEDVIFEAIGYCYEKQKNYPIARKYYQKASQLSPKDDSIFYKIGETYSREQKWEKAVKAYSVALHLKNDNATYCLAIGNCLMELDVKNEALICYLNAVKLKPFIKATWVALIKGLFLAELYEEALNQIQLAEEHCGEKAEFIYFKSAVLFQKGKSKEAHIQLENALKLAPIKAKMFLELHKEFMQRSSIIDLIAKYKKSKKNS